MLGIYMVYDGQHRFRAAHYEGDLDLSLEVVIGPGHPDWEGQPSKLLPSQPS